MTDTILVLTEDTLSGADIAHLLSVHEGETLAYHVLVPADTERNLLVALVDELSLGDVREALELMRRREPREDKARTTATERLAASLAAFAAAGRVATGAVVDDDPLPALKAGVADGAREVAVVTYPHAVEDTFHTDWASRARETLKVPVLHLYAGSSELG